MKHFKLVEKNIDIVPFMAEIVAYEKPWNDKRAKALLPHKDTLSIHLRVPIVAHGQEMDEVQLDRKTEHYILFPKLTFFLEQFAKKTKGELARITIVSLKPNSQVTKHIDRGSYYAKRDRYHLVLQSPAGSRMVSGDEESTWHTGELWWFDNKAMHEAFNPSGGAERIHVIFDVLPKKPFWKKFF